MLDLNNRDWAPFKISDLFQPARGTEKNITSLQVGDVPLISARNCDNGVKAFVSIPNERLHRSHAITLNNDGDGGAGLAYYQPMEFALDTQDMPCNSWQHPFLNSERYSDTEGQSALNGSICYE